MVKFGIGLYLVMDFDSLVWLIDRLTVLEILRNMILGANVIIKLSKTNDAVSFLFMDISAVPSKIWLIVEKGEW